jgi:predicted ribosomally synthesized peptide with nif11-like leader
MTGDTGSAIDRLAEDEELRRLVRSAKTPEQVVRVLADRGVSVTVDDVVVTGSPEHELSDVELGMVSGGTSPYVSVYVVCQPSPPSQHFVFGHCIP